MNRLSKRTLVTVSHAIEQAALAGAEDGPMVVIALFQRLPYFNRERAVYERIARVATTVVCVVAEQALDLPAGAHGVVLEEKEDLAREWAVVVLTPRFGAALVALDREEIEDADTIESGRTFDGWWRYRRDDALHEVLRLRDVLADRLPPAAVSAIDDIVSRVRDVPPTPGEARTDASVRMLVDKADRDHARWRTAVTTRDAALSGPLTTETTIDHWSGSTGVTASGTLTIALLAVKVTHVPGNAGQFGRTAARQTEATITALTSRLRPVDRATRVGEDEFVLFLPGLAYDAAIAFAYQIGADFAAAREQNSFLSASATVAVTVTRRRPFPVDKLREALRWALSQGVPVATVDT